MTAVKHEKALDKLEEQARALIPRLTGDGESLSSLGLTEVSEAGQTRGDLIEGTPPELIQTVFDMQPGDWQVIRDSDGVILVRLDRIVPADHSTDEAKAAKAAFGERVAQEIGIDLESAYARAIQDRAGIALDQAVINAVERQFP
ncbi:MAG TPA: peptidyl-prolyl cis-trans isomerase [Aliiroseovarius sp.]|nr:peptidyl-prolyl cis-trans isomerase [Aliiroseovarius sp.]